MGAQRILSRLEPPTETECHTCVFVKVRYFVLVGSSNRDQMPLGPLVPVGATNLDKSVALGPGWWLQPEQKAPTLPAYLASR